MKPLKSMIVVLLLAVIAVGCGKTEKILPRKTGTWTATSNVFTSYVNSAVDTTWTDPGPYTYFFDKTGSATITDATGTYTVTWYVNPEGDLMTICENTVSSQDCIQYLILESESNLQHWKATIAGAVNGTYVEQDLTIERAD